MKTEARTLADIARAHGYTPAEFTVRRLAEDTSKVARWIADLERGLQPEELAAMARDDCAAFVAAQAKSLMDREKEWADYFYPRLKASDDTVSMTGEVTLLDLLKNANRRDSEG